MPKHKGRSIVPGKNKIASIKSFQRENDPSRRQKVELTKTFGAPAVQANCCKKMLRLSISAFVLFLGLTMWISNPAQAQVLYGSMVGTVTDSSGAAVPGATVLITSIETGQSRNATTDSGGVYTISTLEAGNYKVTVTKQGFDTSV